MCAGDSGWFSWAMVVGAHRHERSARSSVLCRSAHGELAGMVGVPDDLLDYEVLEPPQGENITLPRG